VRGNFRHGGGGGKQDSPTTATDKKNNNKQPLELSAGERADSDRRQTGGEKTFPRNQCETLFLLYEKQLVDSKEGIWH